MLTTERTGTAYLFEPEDSEWAEQMKLQPETGGLGDRFGTSVALSDRRGFVGASDGESERMADTGAVHVFSV